MAVVVIVVLLDAATWFYFSLGCTIGQNASFQKEFCERQLDWLPAISGVLVITAGFVSGDDRRWPLLVAASAGVAVAAGLWVAL